MGKANAAYVLVFLMAFTVPISFIKHGSYLLDILKMMKPGEYLMQAPNNSEEILAAFQINETNSPLRDKTVTWDTSIHRLWLDPAIEEPPAMILLTSLGWNHENQTFGLSLYRGIRTSELYEGIINHALFHPTAWDDIESGRMSISNTTRYYIFVDYETCYEKNYPYYGYGSGPNRDQSGGRGIDGLGRNTILELVSAKLLTSMYSKIVIFDCRGSGPLKFFHRIRRDRFSPNKLAFVSISTTEGSAGPWDQGLPPP
jgi:hypothetical protein